ncbi:hypothetical protein D3C71_181880 [compost metagenome]
MSTRHVHVFISHSWLYPGHYETLEEWIFHRAWRFGQARLVFRNFSVPQDNPIEGARSDKQLRDAIHNQIARSHVVVVPLAMYAGRSRWVREEISGSGLYGKPVLGVRPRGQLRHPAAIGAATSMVVGWTAVSVVKGIWALYR